MEHKINNCCGSWWYIEVLWYETTVLCKKLNIIYTIKIQSLKQTGKSDSFLWNGSFGQFVTSP